MIRVVLPAHLRTLAQVSGEVALEVAAPVTPSAVLDALEARFPVLQGTIRERPSLKRRSLVRFFACGADWSHESTDRLLPEPIVRGDEPFEPIGRAARNRSRKSGSGAASGMLTVVEGIAASDIAGSLPPGLLIRTGS